MSRLAASAEGTKSDIGSHPSAEAAELQRRLRASSRLLRNGYAHFEELDAIATAMGALAMRLEGFEPAGRVFRPPTRRG